MTLTLADEIDISRGDMLVRAGEASPSISAAFDAHLVWMADAPLLPGREYWFKLAGRQVTGRVVQILRRIDVNSGDVLPAERLTLNEIGLCRIQLDAPVVFDPYRRCRHTGNFIVIDRFSHATAAGGMIERAVEAGADPSHFAAFVADLEAVIGRYYPGRGIDDLSDLLSRRADR
jgi:sulfate adenylyltransferase subunit 1